MAIVKCNFPLVCSAQIGPGVGSTGNVTLDAAGESFAAIGRVRLSGGAGTGPKTLSSSGGRILWLSGSPITFANAGTTLDIGVQDVSSGLEDGSYDVSASLVGGTDTITTNSIINTAMESGTKSIDHDQLIAIVATMVSRGGADSVLIKRVTTIGNQLGQSFTPYGSTDTGTLSKGLDALIGLIRFDDGTTGWIDGLAMGHNLGSAQSSVSFSSASTPDEYIGTWESFGSYEIGTIGAMVGGLATTDAYELILYSDPYGTPVAERTVSCTAVDSGTTSGTPGPIIRQITPFTTTSGSDYGIAVRPTTGTVSYGYFAFADGTEYIKDVSFGGQTMTVAARSDQTGAFVLTSDEFLPIVYLGITGFEAGGGSGGFVGIIGG